MAYNFFVFNQPFIYIYNFHSLTPVLAVGQLLYVFSTDWTWKPAVATLLSINLKPLKPAIQLPKKNGTDTMFSREFQFCFPFFSKCHVFFAVLKRAFHRFYPSATRKLGYDQPKMDVPCRIWWFFEKSSLNGVGMGLFSNIS